MARLFVVLAVVAFAGVSQASISSLVNVNEVVGANIFPENVSLFGSLQNLVNTLNDDNTMSTVFQNYLNKVGSAKGELKDDLTERIQNLKSNIAKVIENNLNILSPIRMAVNQFSDMSAAEFKATHTNAVPEASQNETSSGDANLGSSLRRKRQASSIPASKNWTAEGMVTPVRDQGQCGSCYAFGSVGTLEAMYAIKCGVKDIDLSEQNLMDCSKPQGNPGGCEGGNAVNSLNYFKSALGLALESDYPYQPKTGTTCQSASTKKGAVTTFNRVTLNDEAALAAAVAQGPVAVMVNADGWSPYSGGIFGAAPKVPATTTTTTTTTTTARPTTKKSFFGSIISTGLSIAIAPIKVPLAIINSASSAVSTITPASTAACSSKASDADHLVVLTGYGTENGQDYWIIKNSWGPTWGEAGYIRIARGSNICGVANNPYQVTGIQC